MIPKELLPRPALRIGVTGRRELSVSTREDEKELASKEYVTEKIRQAIHEALSRIKEAATAEFERASHFYQAKSPEFRAVSPLAEGSDRVFAEVALELQFALECPLPFHRDEYSADFETAASKKRFYEQLTQANGAVLELDGRTESEATKSAAYETVGRLVVDQCDLLIAIWDGKPDKGPGGTSAMIDFAIGKVPVICLRMDEVPHEIYGQAGRRRSEPYSHEAIRRLIEHMIVPPQSVSEYKEDNELTDSHIQGLSERNSWLGWIWKLFLRIVLIGTSLPKAAQQNVPNGHFHRFYGHFDGYANRLSGEYRGAFLVNYVLGVLAVYFALLGAAFRAHEPPVFMFVRKPEADFVEQGLVCAELLAIGLIVWITRRLKKHRWHYRSVDFRYLGEQFRALCYLDALALSPPRPKLPAHHLGHDVQKSWMEWLLRAVVRESRMTHRIFDRDKFENERARILGWVHGQIQYHSRNAERLGVIDARLRWLANMSLLIIVVSCAVHISLRIPIVLRILGVTPNSLVEWGLLAIAAGLPAFSAACHAIASQGEFERLAERSRAMNASLDLAAKELRDMKTRSGSTVGDLREVTRTIAELAVEEVVDWQILYPKPVPPA